jgi:D-alanine-D-alanine ligase
MELIAAAVRAAGHTTTMINICDNLETLRAAIVNERPDAILNLVEFFGDDFEHEHHIAAFYELLGVAYTGNRPTTLSLCQKKPHAKALLVAAGVPTPNGIVVPVGGVVPAALALRFPLIVKPALEDASGGIDAGSVVADRAALEARVALVLTDYKMPALVEEYLDGREIHCAILGGEPLPLFEMEFLGGVDSDGRPLPRIITYRAKWDPYSQEFYAMESRCPAIGLSADETAAIQAVALHAYQALGCRDYARVDMRLDPATGIPHVLEVNPNPDLADGCAFAQCVRASGRSYERLIGELLDFALARAATLAAAKGVARAQDDLLREYLATRPSTP